MSTGRAYADTKVVGGVGSANRAWLGLLLWHAQVRVTSYRGNHDRPAFLVQNDNERYQSVVNTEHFTKKSEYFLHPSLQFVEEQTKSGESSSSTVYSSIVIRMRIDRLPESASPPPASRRAHT